MMLSRMYTGSKVVDELNGGGNVSMVIPVKGKENKFVVSLDRSVCTATWDGESDKVTDIKKIVEVEPGTSHVFNDGKCDHTGRLWIGTMGKKATDLNIPEKQGTLYSIEKKTVKSHRREIGIANGLAFDPKRNKMYYIDSFAGTVDQYDIDFTTGTLSNLQPICNRSTHGLDHCLFDGMTIDSNGNLWVAVFNGSRVIQIDPRVPDKLLQTIEMPVPHVTSVAFGGDNFDELYVTTARFSPTPGPLEGCTFRVTGINAKGLPPDEFVE
ncbi:unnamed protein product [Acanthoscelides obtectus]|uniref:SMP-30/Gluconolactonase/LRE-like region domain-containing protein n=1 Tax=Acanthoscelides obtectus TaxID=200917 RepID=A0A9P0KP47_ACAOB|nr:unnamed protein product [Acanthoscelides obtectus]CAK1664468.1 Regucalcin [Acanthoscelides obtectus]